MMPGPASRLLVVVYRSSERTVEPVRQDSSFAEKQEPHPALVLVVPSGRLPKVGPRRMVVATKAYTLLVFAGLWALMQGVNDLVRAFEVRRVQQVL